MPHHGVWAMTLSDKCMQVSDNDPPTGQERMAASSRRNHDTS
jgi:hypothetical protein